MSLPVQAWREDLNNELIYAAENGNVVAVKSLLGRGANPNFMNDGGTVLWYASASSGDHVDIIRLRIRYGANVNDNRSTSGYQHYVTALIPASVTCGSPRSVMDTWS